jgi:ABC-2 type transport system permease protein
LFYFLMLLLCGVNVPLDALPGALAAVGRALPLTHGIEAARAVAAGAPLHAVDHLIAQEALVGAAYGVAAYALLRLFEAEGRRRGTLETM